MDSEEFELKYLRNAFPAVVNIATLVKRAYSLSVERAGLEERLVNLREDRRHNSYLPGELYRFIQQLRTEVDSLQSRVRELEAFKAEKERQEKEEQERRRIGAASSFDLFSNPAETSWNSSTSTLTYSGPIAHNYAVSTVPLPSDRPFQWKVEVVSAPSNWLFLGIIGKTQGIASDNQNQSSSDSSCYGWGPSNGVFVAGGNESGQGGWTHWQQGDRGLFTYSPVERTLSLRLEKTDTEYTIVDLPSTYTAHIHCGVYFTNTAVRLSAVV